MYFALRPILGFALVLLRSETTYQVEPPARPPCAAKLPCSDARSNDLP
jgi:hypothetical protein